MAESKIKDGIKNAREMHKRDNEPDGEHNADSYFGEVTLHLFQCAANVSRHR